MTQFSESPGVIDLSWGHPDPDLLPVRELAEATARALDRYGPDMLAYGSPAGPPPLVDFVCERLGTTDGRAPQPSEVVISAGVSHALGLVATLLTRPGDCVLIDVPTYHLAVRILADEPLELVPIASDDDGLCVDELRDAVAGLRAAAKTARLIYTVPTFHNPTGRSMSVERRRALLAAATDLDLRVVEDDTYRELSFEGSSLPSLWSMSDPGRVVRLGSFSKSVAPGLRVGFVTADVPTAGVLVDSGLLDSGGGPAHFAATVLSEYAASGAFSRHVEGLRAVYRQRRDALVDGMDRHLPDGVTWAVPDGGFFVWAKLPDAVADTALAAATSAHAVGFLPESRFGIGSPPVSRAIRLSFSLYPEDELEAAARRLGPALASALTT